MNSESNDAGDGGGPRLRTAEEYRESLRDDRRVFYRGTAVEDVTTHPVFSLAIDHAVMADAIDVEPVRAALRELREETGLTAERMTLLSTLQIAYGVMNQKHHVFLAEGLTMGEPDRDAAHAAAGKHIVDEV